MTSETKTAGESADYEAAADSSPQAVASFDEHHHGLGHKIQHTLHQTPSLVPLIVLVLSIIAFGILLGSKFFSPFALTLILQQVQIVGIVAAAQSIVILTAGIDLSVGAIMVLSSVVMGQFTFRYGLPVEVAVACGLLWRRHVHGREIRLERPVSRRCRIRGRRLAAWMGLRRCPDRMRRAHAAAAA